MYLSLIISIISIIIAILSAIFTGIELWKNNFSRFKPITLVGDLALRIYPIENDQKKWFLPSIDVPISIVNEAACPGKILSVRISVTFPKLPIQGNKEIFYPKWEVNAGKFGKYGKARFDWIEKAVVNDWMPFIILSKTSITKHIIFEPKKRWDDPVIQEKVIFTMEIFTEPERKWRQIGKWKFSLSERIWSEMTESGTSITAERIDAYQIEKEEIYPADLHKYTGTKNPIPKGGFKAKPSSLAYPSEKNTDSQTPSDVS